jgi:hypothetical protein
MTEVMGEMIAFGFQGVIVLIFDLPAGASGQNNLGYVVLADFVVGGKVSEGTVLLPFSDCVPIHA